MIIQRQGLITSFHFAHCRYQQSSLILPTHPSSYLQLSTQSSSFSCSFSLSLLLDLSFLLLMLQARMVMITVMTRLEFIRGDAALGKYIIRSNLKPQIQQIQPSIKRHLLAI